MQPGLNWGLVGSRRLVRAEDTKRGLHAQWPDTHTVAPVRQESHVLVSLKRFLVTVRNRDMFALPVIR